MNYVYSEFDKERGSLRILLILYTENIQSRMQLINTAKSIGISQSAVYKILQTLKKIDFITETTTKNGQKQTHLTTKGALIAMELEEIHKILEYTTPPT